MKEQPNVQSNQKQARAKLPYSVTIEDTSYHTFAYTEEAALSNAAFRYAQENNMGVGLVMFRIKKGEIYSNVEEV